MKINGSWQETGSSLFTVITALMLVSSIVLSACGIKEAPTEILIGALLPLTGDLSSSGETSKASLDIAVKDINQYLSDIGLGKSIKLIVKDTNTDNAVAVEKLSELSDKGVKVVIGPGSSAELKAVKEYASEKDIMIVSHASTASFLAIPGDNVFRLVPDDTHQGEAIAGLMWKQGRIAVITMWRDDVWGKGLFKATKNNFEEAGGIVIDDISYATNPISQDFSTELELLSSKVSKAKDKYGANSVGVHLIAFKEVEKIFAQAQNYPVLSSVKWYGSDGTAINKVLVRNEQAAQFAISVGFPNPILGEVMTGKSEIVKAKIRATLKREPNVYSLAAYDVLWIVTKAYLAIGTKTSDALKQAIRQEAKQYTGITGWTFLNEAGDRKFGNYDFWAVVEEGGSFQWKRLAIYRIDPILPGKVIYVEE